MKRGPLLIHGSASRQSAIVVHRSGQQCARHVCRAVRAVIVSSRASMRSVCMQALSAPWAGGATEVVLTFKIGWATGPNSLSWHITSSHEARHGGWADSCWLGDAARGRARRERPALRRLHRRRLGDLQLPATSSSRARATTGCTAARAGTLSTVAPAGISSWAAAAGTCASTGSVAAANDRRRSLERVARLEASVQRRAPERKLPHSAAKE